MIKNILINRSSKILSIVLFIIIIGTNQNSYSQPNYQFEVGIIDSVYSNIQKESRELYIHLPESYDSNSQRKYPVIYVLDGDVLLNAVSTVHDFYWGGYMPEMIIVGISNENNRTRDLTTSKIESRCGTEYNQEHGGANDFIMSIEKELIPYIEKNYPVTNYRTLIGHSYGGLFTINVLINHTYLFENYLAIDPSLDWDNQKLLKQSKEVIKSKSLEGKSLFITLSGQLHMQNYDITINNVMQDSSEYTLFARSNIEFFKFAESNKQDNFNIKWKFYKDDLHGTVPLPSILDGLVYFFEWYQMENTDRINSFDTPKEELYDIIKYRAKKLQSHFRYQVPPYPEDLLIMSGYMNLDMEQAEKAKMYFEFAIEYYPESANAYDSMAEYYALQNDFENAIKNMTRAFEISGNSDFKKRIEDFKKMKDGN